MSEFPAPSARSRARRHMGLVVILLAILYGGWALSSRSASVNAQDSLLARQGLAGSGACAPCHPATHRTHATTSMRAALLRPESNLALRDRTPLRGVIDGAAYTIEKLPDGSFMQRVEFEGQTLQARVLWAFGLGAAGQTYILEHEGALVESRVSYYHQTRGLDLTIGAANQRPATVLQALGRKMNQADIRECFGCHALGVPAKGEPVLDGIELGVGCENCHGPAAAHVAARKAGNLATGKMPSLVRQEAEEISQLCGQCHRTWEDVVSLRIRGVNNVRFQPYRLTLSRCYDSSDARSSCVSCHNPHQNVVTEASIDDARCQACHRTGEAAPMGAAASCKAGETANCSNCHMPKRELPGAHRLFTDHYIRVHRPGEAYPDL